MRHPPQLPLTTHRISAGWGCGSSKSIFAAHDRPRQPALFPRALKSGARTVQLRTWWPSPATDWANPRAPVLYQDEPPSAVPPWARPARPRRLASLDPTDRPPARRAGTGCSRACLGTCALPASGRASCALPAPDPRFLHAACTRPRFLRSPAMLHIRPYNRLPSLHIRPYNRLSSCRSGAVPPNVVKIGTNIKRPGKRADGSMFRQLGQATFEPWRRRLAPWYEHAAARARKSGQNIAQSKPERRISIWAVGGERLWRDRI